MSVKIRVLNSNGRPVAGATVHVRWSAGGFSRRSTDDNGIADLQCSSGTASSIEINGQSVESGIWLKDGITSVSYR